MSGEIAENHSWRATLLSWTHPRAITMLFLGFSSGLPLALVFGTLSLWLREAGVSRSTVTFFSWAALPFSFKFIWAPLIDLLPLPLLTRLLGRRRSWLLTAQSMVIIAICWMAMADPTASRTNLITMALAAVLLGFSAASQDIVIDAYRIECAEKSMQAMLAAMYITGYRIAMVASGAGVLYLATWFGQAKNAYLYSAWRSAYLVMAVCMLVGVVTTLVISEPDTEAGEQRHEYSSLQYARILSLFLLTAAVFILTFFHGGTVAAQLKQVLLPRFALSGKVLGFLIEVGRFAASVATAALTAWILVLAGWVDREMVRQSYVLPVKDFLSRYGARIVLLLLLLIGFYRVSDIVLGAISNVFYLDLGFSNVQIATISKTFGIAMSLVGSVFGGMLTVRYGIFRILFVGALLSAATNLLFMFLARSGADTVLLAAVISADNLCGGLAVTAFVAFLSSLTSVSFTATQYAIFSSLMTLFPKLLGGYSGTIVTAVGYGRFFLITALMGVPVLLLVWLARGIMNENGGETP